MQIYCVTSKGARCIVYLCISYSYAPVMDNSGSPSIVEQLSQGPSLVTIPLLVIVS